MKDLLMIYDGSKKSQADKIKDACAAYRRKFGQPATKVYVNHKQVVDVAGLDVIGKRNVLKNHLQVGVATIDNQ